MDQEIVPRRTAGLAAPPTPERSPEPILAVLASRAALAELIAADVLSEPGVVAVDGRRGVGKTAMLDLVAARLRGRGRLVIPVAGPFSSEPLSPLTPARITDALLLASGAAIGSDDVSPERLLRSLLTQPGLRDLVLLIDDADTLPHATWRFLDLLLRLAQFGKARLRLVLFGAPGRWPDPGKLPRLGSGLVSARVIEPLSRAEAAHYATTLAERTGRVLDRGRLERILNSANGSLAQLDAAVRDTTPVPSGTTERSTARRFWPALVLGGPVLAGVAAFAVHQSRPRPAPAVSPPVSVALVDAVAPPEAAPKPPPPTEAAPPPVLPGAAGSGKVIAGAAAVGVVLAHLEVAAAHLASNAPGLASDGAGPATPALTPPTIPSHVPPPGPMPRPASDGLSPVRGLLLVARPGDTLATLYSEVYRGRSAPPFADISSANPAPVRPGALVVFPAPPGGWSRP